MSAIKELTKNQWYNECPRCLSGEEFITTDVEKGDQKDHKIYFIRCLHCGLREKWYETIPGRSFSEKGQPPVLKGKISKFLEAIDL